MLRGVPQSYQPLVVGWAETGLVLADEFRDGNVPAGHGIKDLVDRAHEALPAGEWRVRVRSDSAAYQWGLHLATSGYFLLAIDSADT